MTINADSEKRPQQNAAEADSPRLKQEVDEASFRATYTAITRLFKTKQKKYNKTFELAFLEGKITLQAIVVMAVLILVSCIFVGTLWCLLNVAIVLGIMQLYSSLWLGLIVAGGINMLLLGIFIFLMRKVKREVGFKRTKQVMKGDSC